jgi:hypothetical protein
MARSNPTDRKFLASMKLIRTGLGLTAILALAVIALPALADDHHGHDGDRHGHWGGGYYVAPPIVYGSPYYYPPPVVYGPGIGIALPGVSIGIR